MDYVDTIGGIESPGEGIHVVHAKEVEELLSLSIAVPLMCSGE